MNQQSNKLLKDEFMRRGVTRCELCGTSNFLSFAHRFKRRHMQTVEELADFNNVLLLDIKCHQMIEFDSEKRDYWFAKLRKNVH